uniref:RNA helicase n=1 Tax=Cuerna arida TaxID=1464854 RepID=A0A1B6F468_9HEMI
MFHFRKRVVILCCGFHKIVVKNTLRCYIEELTVRNYSQKRGKNKSSTPVSTLFVPISVKSNPDDINVGAELTGTLNKGDLLKVLNKFYQKPEIKVLCLENGLDSYIQQQVYVSFRKFCLEAESLPADLHVVFSDILQDAGHVDDIFPYYLRHARQIFPHLECMDDLRKISDLRSPANWYPNARSLNRRIIFHAGPTNSGKTYHALERYFSAKSGVYCGPLKLLATEVFKKSNDRGTPCDLVTGEERRYVNGEDNPASHVSCTVEMTSVNIPYEVAVIDEIQMMRDPGRGWAWTRALLGVAAEEIHVCGEEGAVDLVKSLAATTGVQVQEADRTDC